MPLRIPPNASSTTWTNVPVSAPYVHNRMRSQSSTASSANIAAVQIQTAGQRRMPIRPRSGRSAAPSAARQGGSALPAEFGDDRMGALGFARYTLAAWAKPERRVRRVKPRRTHQIRRSRILSQIGIVTDPQRTVALVARVDRHDDLVADNTRIARIHVAAPGARSRPGELAAGAAELLVRAARAQLGRCRAEAAADYAQRVFVFEEPLDAVAHVVGCRIVRPGGDLLARIGIEQPVEVGDEDRNRRQI